MAGRKCAMPDCLNYEWQANKQAFFRFPKDDKLCEEWVLKSNRKELYEVMKAKGPLYLNKTYRICAEHFAVKDFRNPQLPSQGLIKGTVPTINNIDKTNPVIEKTSVLEKDETPDMKNDETCENTQDTSKRDTTNDVKIVNLRQPKKIIESQIPSLKKKLKMTQKLLSKYRKLVTKLRDDLKSCRDDTKLKYHALLNGNQNCDCFTFMQKNVKNSDETRTNGRNNSNRDITLALAIYSCSSETYRILRPLFNFPSVKSLLKWKSILQMKDKVDPNLLKISHLCNKKLRDKQLSGNFNDDPVEENIDI